jgi:hypothetical protein
MKPRLGAGFGYAPTAIETPRSSVRLAVAVSTDSVYFAGLVGIRQGEHVTLHGSPSLGSDERAFLGVVPFVRDRLAGLETAPRHVVSSGRESRSAGFGHLGPSGIFPA